MPSDRNYTSAFDLLFDARQAVIAGDIQQVKRLLGMDRAALQQRDEMGSTLLHTAAAYGQTKIVGLLVEGGFDINAVDKFGGSPLFEATYRDHREVVQLLKSHGAKLRVPRGNRLVAWLQIIIGIAALAGIILLLIVEDKGAGSTISILLLGGTSLLAFAEGGKGLRGLQTFANS